MPSATCLLTLKQVAVLCLLYSPNMRAGLSVTPSHAHLSSVLRVDVKTVRQALHKLEQAGLLRDGTLVRPTPEMLAWWEDRPAATRVTGGGPAAHEPPTWEKYSQWFPKLIAWLDDYLPEGWAGMIDKAGRMFEAAAYPFQEAGDVLVEVLNDTRKISVRAGLIRNLPSLIRKAEDTTARYREQGQFHGANSLGLFKKMLRAEADISTGRPRTGNRSVGRRSCHSWAAVQAAL
jgi:hypothetical protein